MLPSHLSALTCTILASKVTCPYHCQWDDESSFSATLSAGNSSPLTEGAMKDQLDEDPTDLEYQTRKTRPESTIK